MCTLMNARAVVLSPSSSTCTTLSFKKQCTSSWLSWVLLPSCNSRPARWPSCTLDAVGDPSRESLERPFQISSKEGKVLRAQPLSFDPHEELSLAPGTDPSSIREWELDFFSRPVLDARSKRVWELVVCDSKRKLQFARFYPNNAINSITLKEAVGYIMNSLQLPKPQKIRFFRAQMQTVILKVCNELDIQPVPSRRCISLIRWLDERYVSVYRQHPGFQDGAAPPLQLEQSFPLELPDALRGEQWAFVQLPLPGSSDRTVRLWEVQTARCCRVWNMHGPVKHIAWNPILELGILAIAVQKEVVLLDTELGDNADEVSQLLTVKTATPATDPTGDGALVNWSGHEKLQALEVKHNQDVLTVSWHHKGDYFASVAPDANTRAVLVHQLSKQQTQNPFRKLQGRVVSVLFHPSRPFLFVATKMHVRVYNLAKQQLSKKLMTGLHEITSMAIHSKGDNMIVGSREGKLCWFDMDLSTKPYKTLKNHREDIQAVAFHLSYPLFASCADDSTAHVFHGMVYSDLLQNPLIVPLKILHGHQKVDGRGILDCQFHTKQPWLFTAGADSVIKLFSN